MKYLLFLMLLTSPLRAQSLVNPQGGNQNPTSLTVQGIFTPSYICPGVFIASGDVTAVSTISISGVFASSTVYEMHLQYIQGANAGIIGVNFNNDTSQAYSYDGANGSGFQWNSNNGLYTIMLTASGGQQYTLPAHTSGSSSFRFHQDYGGVYGVTLIAGTSESYISAPNWIGANFGGHYSGSAAISSLQITTSTGYENAHLTANGSIKAHYDICKIGTFQ